ncbi:MAG: DMT family transporter [Syntrophomonadaceae bacterium]|nr:DMT family transporter [Syntrophomonadaceae bacterium]
MSVIKSNLLLLLAAAIWGFAFVAQRVGMEHVGPFIFNGVRFFLGSISLLPLVWYFRNDPHTTQAGLKNELLAGLLAGSVLFMGASLQQIGLIYTTAGKSAFITCLYIVLVPILGRFLGDTINRATWLGCILAVVGLYFLSIKGSFSIQIGDLMLLIGALFWAFHILIIGHFSRRVDVLKLSCYQFLTCALLSLITAAFTETIILSNLMAVAIPILYGGFCSVGIAYTLQVVGQKHAPPAHAAIILSMETVFAVIGGYLLLGERISGQEFIGCILMLTGMLVSQLGSLKKSPDMPVKEMM